MTDDDDPLDARTKALQQRLGRGWEGFGFAEEPRPANPINRSEVPEPFHGLIPYVEQFHTDRDATPGALVGNQPRADSANFYQAVLPHWDALIVWLCGSP